MFSQRYVSNLMHVGDRSGSAFSGTVAVCWSLLHEYMASVEDEQWLRSIVDFIQAAGCIRESRVGWHLFGLRVVCSFSSFILRHGKKIGIIDFVELVSCTPIDVCGRDYTHAVQGMLL